MENRRQFFKKLFGLIGGVSIVLFPLATFVQKVYGKAKKVILPKGTERNSLIQKDPETLDTRNLEVTPLEEFETMGITDYKVDLSKWRLIVEGAVQAPLQFTYEEIKNLPSMEREILLICPGFFAIHGRWKGIDMDHFLRKVKAEKGSTHLTFYGPEGNYEKVERFPMDDIRKGKVFLA